MRSPELDLGMKIAQGHEGRPNNGYLEVGEGEPDKGGQTLRTLWEPMGSSSVGQSTAEIEAGEASRGLKGMVLRTRPGSWHSRLGNDLGRKIIPRWCGQGARLAWARSVGLALGYKGEGV